MLLKIYRFRLYSEYCEYYIQYACKNKAYACTLALDYALEHRMFLDNPTLVGYLPVDSAFTMPKSPIVICPKES